MARCTCILIVCLSIICRSYSAQKKWTGANGASWDNQANWYPAGSPNDTDDIILDNTFQQSAYTVILPATQVSIHSLLIQPGQNSRIELVLPASNTTSPALYVTSSLQSIVIRNGGVFRNSSGLNGSASVRINGMLSIYNGGSYIHNTRSSHATELVAKLSDAPGTENGTFEFDVPGGSYPISLSNRTYGNLVLSSVSSGENQTYNASGSNICIINGDFRINHGVVFNLDFTRDLVVNGRYIQKGGTFNVASQLNYNVVKLKGAILQEAAGVITETMGWPVIEMAGTINQHVSFAGAITNDVAIRVNNPAGVTLLTNMAVPFRFQFLNGIVKTSGASLLIFQHKSSASGANGRSYTDGPLVKRGNDDFEFPTGKQGDYAPVKFLHLAVLLPTNVSPNILLVIPGLHLARHSKVLPS